MQFQRYLVERAKLLKFYEYYRDFLYKEHQAIQNRHEQIITKLVKQNKSKLQQIQIQNSEISYVKIMRNMQLINLILGKSIYDHSSMEVLPLRKQQRMLIIQMMHKDFVFMKGHIFKKWMELAKFIINFSKSITRLYKKQYHELCRERYKNNVFSHKIKNHDWRLSKYDDSRKMNLQQAFCEKKKGLSQEELWKEYFPIQNVQFFGKSEKNIKMFQQIYITNNQECQSKKLKHIVVLVHGFQASRQDFILLKNCLQVTYGIQVIISTCNQGLTESSIITAGQRLANQVNKILQNQSSQFRLSFIGHSMGGLIIRSAIPRISKQLKGNFYTYMSFSTPHLGYLYQSSALVKAGLWILNAFQKIQALQQISMKDHPNLRETVLYRLSKNDSLKQFKKICFVCSSLDEYVVYESARVEQNESLMSRTVDENSQKIIREMVNGIIGEIKASEISRINVVFNIENKNLDSFIGRTGHIKFLSDIQFIRQFCTCFDKFFI